MAEIRWTKSKHIGCWVFAFLVVWTLGAILLPVFFSARAAADTTTRIDRVKQAAVAIQMYEGDNSDALPLRGRWAFSIQTYFKDPSILAGCEGIPGATSTPCGFEFDEKLSGQKIADIDLNEQLVRERPSGPNADHYFWAGVDARVHRASSSNK